MKESEIHAIKARCEAATPGPWDSEDCEYIFAKVKGGRPNGEGIALFSCYTNRQATNGKADANFAAHAREDIPRLVAEVEKLRTALIVNEESIRMFFEDGLDEGIIIHRHRLREHAKRIRGRIRKTLGD